MVSYGYVGEKIYDDFTVNDQNGNLIENLKSSDFTYHLFNSFGKEVSSLIKINIRELGFGHYRVNFTPNKKGLWYLIIYHNIYFPWGKAGNFNIEIQNEYMNIINELKKLKKKRIKP